MRKSAWHEIKLNVNKNRIDPLKLGWRNIYRRRATLYLFQNLIRTNATAPVAEPSALLISCI